MVTRCFVAMGLVVFGASSVVAQTQASRVRVAKETTAITEPLGADGLPDYVAAINARYGKGVTAENNGFVMWWGVMPARLQEAERPKAKARIEELLGVKGTEPRSVVYENYFLVMKRNEDEDQSRAQAHAPDIALDLAADFLLELRRQGSDVHASLARVDVDERLVAARWHHQDAGMLARRARGEDPVISLVLGEAQDLRAVGEERREARGEMQFAGLELREMGHEADRRVTPGARQAEELFGQLGVREVGWSGGRHGLLLSRRFSRVLPRTRARESRDGFRACLARIDR